MLQTPPLRRSCDDPILAIITGVHGGRVERAIEPGFHEISHFSGDMLVWGSNAPEIYMGYPDLGELSCFGVCDTPAQFIERYRKMLSDDVRTFFCTFTHIKKDPSNRGQRGGWRWHKWGPYIGTGTPDCEYLDDEDGFADGVYVYHVLQIDGPEKV